MTDLLTVRESIRSCTACSLRETAIAPVPWSGPTPSKYLFIGMAPGYMEDAQGRPFIGAAGNLLGLMLREAQFPRDIAYANAVCCFPGRGQGGDNTPTKRQLAACQPNLKAQIDVVEPSYIFLVGGTALEAFRPDLSLSWMHGRPMFYDVHANMQALKRSIYVWTIYHPAAALRSKKYEASIQHDLASFWRWRRDGEIWPEDCVVCGKDIVTLDSWGVGMCELHSMRQGTLPLEEEEAPSLAAGASSHAGRGELSAGTTR